MKRFLQLILVCSVLVYACNASKKTSTNKSKTTVTTTTTTTTVEETTETDTKAESAESPGSITFDAASSMYKAKGTFKQWSFTKVEMEDDNLETLTAALEVDLTSIWEKNPKLTAHLKAPDFFHIDQYTTATIDIANVKKTGDNAYTADMTLNMKGVTQEMTSEFMVTNTNPIHVKGTAKVNRNLFSLGGEGGIDELIVVTYDTDLTL